MKTYFGQIMMKTIKYDIKPSVDEDWFNRVVLWTKPVKSNGKALVSCRKVYLSGPNEYILMLQLLDEPIQ